LGEGTWLVLIALGYVLVGVLLFGRALGPWSYLLYGRDTVSHDYIMLLYGWQETLGRHFLPLWCPYLFGGVPLIGSFAFCPFYPSQWLYAIVPFNTAFTLQYLLAIALGGVTSALWARHLGCSRLGAMCAGLLFCVSGHFLTLVHAGHLQKVMAIAWAPLALAMAPKLCERGSRALRAMLVVAVALAMQLFASHTQIAYATASAVLGFAIASFRGQRWSHPLVLVRNFAGAIALSAVLSAAQFFPGMETAALSNRADGVSFAEAVETSYPPRELWEFVIPRVFGDSVSGSPVPYFGSWGERIVSDFIGVSAVLLALIGLFAGKGPSRRMLAITTVISLLIGLGRYTPIYRFLYEHLPGFSRFRSPGTFMFLASVCLVQLAALGLEVLWRGIDGDPLRFPRTRVLVVVGFGGLLGLLMTAAPAAIGPLLGIGTAEQWAKFGSVLGQNIRAAGMQFVASAALIAVTAMAVLAWESSPGGQRSQGRYLFSKLAFIALVLMTVLVPALANRYFIRFAPFDDYLLYLSSEKSCASKWTDEPAPRDIVWLAKLCFAPRARSWTSVPKRIMGPNLLDNRPLLSRTGSPAGYHPVFLKRYADLVQSLGWYHPQLLRQYAVHEVAADASLSLPASEWEQTGSRDRSRQCWQQRFPKYLSVCRRLVVCATSQEVMKVLAADPHATPPQRPFVTLRWASEFTTNGVDSPLDQCEWAVVEASRLWRAGLPVFWMANSEDWFIWFPRAYARLMRDQVELRASCPQGISRVRPLVTFDDYRPGAMKVTLFYHDQGIILLAENYCPGWKVASKGRKQVTVLPVNHAQLGILFRPSPGDSPLCLLELTYAPFSWRLGLFLSLIAWATLFAYVLAHFMQKTRFHDACKHWTMPALHF
jgi:hypothetical protein